MKTHQHKRIKMTKLILNAVMTTSLILGISACANTSTEQDEFAKSRELQKKMHEANGEMDFFESYKTQRIELSEADKAALKREFKKRPEFRRPCKCDCNTTMLPPPHPSNELEKLGDFNKTRVKGQK